LIGRIDPDEVLELEVAHQQLLDRREEACQATPGGEQGDPRRIREYALLLRQMLLHRAIGTFEGATIALRENQVYSMVLSIRGHFETTAALGYLCARLNSLAKDNLSREAVDRDICTMLLGRRDGSVIEAPEAKQILSLLEQADKAVSEEVLGGTSKQYDILSDCYTFLCEFCHPNFHSNSVAFDLNKTQSEFVMRHSAMMRDDEAKLLHYLLVSTPVFVHLYDRIHELVPSAAT
jgi:hypothetical protein